MSKSRKGLKRHGMRGYLVEGPGGAQMIVERDRPWRWFVKDPRHGKQMGDFFAIKFKRLGAARAYAEQRVGA